MDIKEEPVDVTDHELSQSSSITSTIGSKMMLDIKVEVEEFCDDHNDLSDSDQDMQMVIDEEANEISKLLADAETADLNKDDDCDQDNLSLLYTMQDKSSECSTYEDLINETLAKHKVLSGKASVELNKFACDVCKLSWEKLWLFTRHLNMNHKGIKLNIVTEKLNYGPDYLIVAQAKVIYMCAICDTTFDTHEENEMHTLKECTICHNTFVECSELLEHERTCKATAALIDRKCKVCSKNFLTNQRLLSHLIIKHEVRSDVEMPVSLRRCVKCAERYVGLRALHSCSKRRSRYYCKFCQEGFQTLILLKVHKKAMTGMEKDCELCGNVFTWLCHYRTHSCPVRAAREVQEEINKEKNPPAMQCSICDDLFRTKADIFYHMAEVHNIFKVPQKEAMILNVEHTKTIPIILKRKKIPSTQTGKRNVTTENGSQASMDNVTINTAQSATERARNTLNVMLSKAVKCHTTKSQPAYIQNYIGSTDSTNHGIRNIDTDGNVPRIESVMSLLTTRKDVQNVIETETKIKQEIMDDDIVYSEEQNEEFILTDDTKLKIEHVECETDMLTSDDIRKVFYPTTTFQTKVKQEPMDEEVKGTAKRKTKLTRIKTEDEQLEIKVVSEPICDEEVYEEDIIMLNSSNEHLTNGNNSYDNIEKKQKTTKSSSKSIKESIYCIKCKKYYKNFGLYMAHFKHKNLFHLQCPICRAMHSSSALYEQHALAHIQRTYRKSRLHSNQYECMKCLQEVTSEQRRNHWLQHHSMISKATCGNRTAVEAPIKPNTEDIPVSDRLLSVDQLAQTLASMTEMGKKTRCKECMLCSRSFSRVSDYKRHLIMHCLEDAYIKKSYLGILRCQHCEADLANAEWYKQHMREHAGLTNYQCHLCCKCFSDSSNFSKHKKVHNIQVMFCDICQRKFKSKNMLVRHLEEHKKTEPIVCNLCSKTFYFPSSYYKHRVNMHFPHLLQRYTCQECKSRFTCLKDKWDHMWVRHGERSCRADCDLCGAGFRKFQDLRTHMGVVHHIRS